VKKTTVYLESSIISYLAANPSRDLIVAAHQQITHDWWNSHRRGFALVISQFVVDEIGAGNAGTAARRKPRRLLRNWSLVVLGLSTPPWMRCTLWLPLSMRWILF